MADIEFNCPECGKHLSVDGKGAGLEVPCPECSRMIQVPDAMSVEGKPKTKPSGRIFNITILLSSLVLAGGLVGSAYLLQQGMAGLGESVVKGLQSSRVNTVTLNHKSADYGGFKIDTDSISGSLSLHHNTDRIDLNMGTLDINHRTGLDLDLGTLDINHHTDSMFINHSGHISQ